MCFYETELSKLSKSYVISELLSILLKFFPQLWKNVKQCNEWAGLAHCMLLALSGTKWRSRVSGNGNWSQGAVILRMYCRKSSIMISHRLISVACLEVKISLHRDDECHCRNAISAARGSFWKPFVLHYETRCRTGRGRPIKPCFYTRLGSGN
jgi:hypothetical protein